MEKHPLGAMLKFADRLLEKSINDNMYCCNVTRSQMDLLGYVHARYRANLEVNQVDIEKNLNLKNPTVSGLIKRLEKKGYIKRDASSKGANYKSIMVTENGLALLEEGKKLADKAEREMFSVLTKEEYEQMEVLLKKVIDNKISKS